MDETGTIRRISKSLIFVLLPLLAISCAGEKEGEQEAEAGRQAATEDKGLEFVDESVSYGLFFDEEGTKRTLRLGKGEDEFMAYLFLMCPDYKEIASTQFRLEMPEGVAIVNDKYRMDRVMSMGTFKMGISERYTPCVQGPKILLHTFTIRVTAPLDNAVFAILPALDAQFLAVTECQEGYPMIRASAFKAVVNPSE